MTDFVHRLLPRLQGALDRIRGIPDALGTRPYRVFLVRARWSPGEPGEGRKQVRSETEILPVPRVYGVSGVSRGLEDLGTTELGQLNVEGVSARYTEQELLGSNLKRGELFWWEIRGNRGEDPRLFVPDAMSDLGPGKTTRSVVLRRYHEDRDAQGKFPRYDA